jgi:hypothetical protein
MNNPAANPPNYGCLLGCLVTTFLSFLVWAAIIKLTLWLIH